MSQHSFKTTHRELPITVLLGWDRPLQYFFMVIENTAPDDDGQEEQDDGYLYSNLNDKHPFGMCLADYQAKLAELGITVPAEMFIRVGRDRLLNVGNRCVSYSGDGSFIEA